MIEEPRIALAASPREWAQRLHRHVADHGGARVRATVLHPRDAVDEDYDVFVTDDTTSFLSPRLLAELRRRGRGVLGVFDPGDGRGREDLLALGVDEVLARDAPPEDFVAAICRLTKTGCRGGPRAAAPGAARQPAAAPGEPVPARRVAAAEPGRITAVAATAGGAGATEMAIALATARARAGVSTVLVDADDVAPSLAQRLGLPTYPNVRALVDAVEHRRGRLADLLLTVPGARFRALPGLGSPTGWSELRAAETVEALRALTRVRRHVLVNVSHRMEDLSVLGAPSRYALARRVVATADAVVAVTTATPVGLTRLLEWVADARALAPEVPVHVLCNRAPASAFKRGEITAEITRTFAPASLWYAPHDPRVEEAAWEGTVVPSGAFARAVAAMAVEVLPATGAARRRGRWAA